MGGINKNMLTYGSAMTKLSPAAQAVRDAAYDTIHRALESIND
jgi:hypothetical protein